MQSQPTPNGAPHPTPTPENHLTTILHTLVDLAATLTQAIHAQAMAQAAIRPEANAPESVRDATAARTATLATAFDRMARCVRRTALMARHFDQPPPEPPAKPQSTRRTLARAQLIRSVENAIDRASYAGRTPDRDALRRELLERLDAPGFDDDLATRKLPELIEELCSDMGLTSPMPFTCPPRRRTPAEIAALRTEAEAPPNTLQTLPPRPAAAAPPPKPDAKQDNKELQDMMALCTLLAPPTRSPAHPACHHPQSHPSRDEPGHRPVPRPRHP